MGATGFCLVKAFVQMLSMYKAKPEVGFGFSRILEFHLRMPQLYPVTYKDGQLRPEALSLTALNALSTKQGKLFSVLAKYIGLHMKSI